MRNLSHPQPAARATVISYPHLPLPVALHQIHQAVLREVTLTPTDQLLIVRVIVIEPYAEFQLAEELDEGNIFDWENEKSEPIGFEFTLANVTSLLYQPVRLSDPSIEAATSEGFAYVVARSTPVERDVPRDHQYIFRDRNWLVTVTSCETPVVSQFDLAD